MPRPLRGLAMTNPPLARNDMKKSAILPACGHFDAVGGVLGGAPTPLPARSGKEFQEKLVFVVERIRHMLDFSVFLIMSEAHRIARRRQFAIPGKVHSNVPKVRSAFAIHAEVSDDTGIGAFCDLELCAGAIAVRGFFNAFDADVAIRE